MHPAGSAYLFIFQNGTSSRVFWLLLSLDVDGREQSFGIDARHVVLGFPETYSPAHQGPGFGHQEAATFLCGAGEGTNASSLCCHHKRCCTKL